jgi:hypothetical protein
MRTGLQSLEGKRATLIATFSRRDAFKTKWGWQGKVLLKHVKDVQFKPLTDHVSITDQSSLQLMAFLKEGDLIVFNAGIRKYHRGYHGDDIDLRLKNPDSVDYMLYDIRNVIKQNLDVPKKMINGDLGFKELMKNKRIVLGVA